VSELDHEESSATWIALPRLLDGLRAGVLTTLLLTLWSFIAISAQMDDAGGSQGAGLLYILTAFGLLATLELGLGAAFGALIALWQTTLARLARPEPADTWLALPSRDALAAAALLAAPLLAAIPAALVLGVHLGVTGSFARVTFQALGLALVAAVGMIGALLASPVLLLPLRGLLLKRGADDATQPTRTRLALTILGAIALLGLAACALYAARLEVFPRGLIAQAVAAVALPPALTLLMRRAPAALQRPAWTIGLPIAGLLAGLACFAGAWGWASSSSDMRQAVSKKEALATSLARVYQRFGDRDHDGAPGSMGGFDCDDHNKDVYPGAEDIPGDGIDQDCSGEDAKPPEAEDHPSRKIVSLAFDAARKAANREASKAQGEQGGQAALPPAPKNVLIVLVDTLRPDHLGFMGYERPTSPNLDKLAARSIVFAGAHAPAPHTPRSIPPLFFSRWASHMKWIGAQYNYPKIKPENLGLFEVLKERGWKNQAVTSHFYFEEKRNIHQGFDRWDNAGATDIPGSNEDIASPRTWARVEPLMEKLAAQQKEPGAAPFGLFVHMFEPHSKWIGHPEYKFDGGDETKTRHMANYDSEVAFVDAYIGKILDKLAETGLDKNTVVVIVSDHGEAFMDHGKYFHGQDLYEEILRVPMVIHVPGWPARRVEGAVSLVDLAPTLVDLFELTIPPDFEGASMLDAMTGAAPVPADRPIFAELLPYTHLAEHHVAMILGDYKLIRVITAGTEELYNLKADPTEQTNLLDKEPEQAKRMRAALDAWLSRR
jgi:arylsulfatase A-like enzyme